MTNCFIFVDSSCNGAYYYRHFRHHHIPRPLLHVFLQLLLCIPFKQFTRPRNNLSAASPSLSGETASVFTLTAWSMITTISNNNMHHDNINGTVTTCYVLINPLRSLPPPFVQPRHQPTLFRTSRPLLERGRLINVMLLLLSGIPRLISRPLFSSVASFCIMCIW